MTLHLSQEHLAPGWEAAQGGLGLGTVVPWCRGNSVTLALLGSPFLSGRKFLILQDGALSFMLLSPQKQYFKYQKGKQ